MIGELESMLPTIRPEHQLRMIWKIPAFRVREDYFQRPPSTVQLIANQNGIQELILFENIGGAGDKRTVALQG